MALGFKKTGRLCEVQKVLVRPGVQYFCKLPGHISASGSGGQTFADLSELMDKNLEGKECMNFRVGKISSNFDEIDP